VKTTEKREADLNIMAAKQNIMS